MTSPFGGGPFGGTGGSSPPVARYLHELSLANATAWGNAQSTKVTAVMRSNGLEVEMQGGAAATINDMAFAFGYSWPLPKDVLGNSVSPISLADNMAQLAILERAVDTLPMEVGAVFGLCEGADPIDAAGCGIGVGLEWRTTTLRSTILWRRTTATGVWARTSSTGGQSTCAGAEHRSNARGTSQTADNAVNPLDSSFNRNTIGSNTVSVATALTADVYDRVFVGFYWAVAGAGTPLFRVDGSLQIMPFIEHV